MKGRITTKASWKQGIMKTQPKLEERMLKVIGRAKDEAKRVIELPAKKAVERAKKLLAVELRKLG